MNNIELARRLREHARSLEATGSNLYRRRALRSAADAIERHPTPMTVVHEADGRRGLEAIPGIGRSLGYTVEVLLTTGVLRVVDPMTEVRPSARLRSLPGIGTATAERLQDGLGVTTIDDLQEVLAAGVASAAGIGSRREESLNAVMAERRRKAERKPEGELSVGSLLEADKRYRKGLRRGSLEGKRYIAEPARTALAHRLGMTGDWVVVTVEHLGRSFSRTVVTETEGEMKGRRVVRGREEECRAWYAESRVGAA